MVQRLEEEINRLESDKDELNRLRAELRYDREISTDLEKKLADINDAIRLITGKIKDLEVKLAELKK